VRAARADGPASEQESPNSRDQVVRAGARGDDVDGGGNEKADENPSALRACSVGCPAAVTD
jgi:hypothetical protein